MSVKIEYTGKDVDQAIKLACTKLNVNREELNIEIITPGSSGIFGFLRKKAVIQVCTKEQEKATDNAIEQETAKGQSEAAQTATPLTSTSKPAQSSHKGQGVHDQPVDQEVLEEIKSTTMTILEQMGFPAQVNLSQQRGKVLAHISADNIEAIIGPEGQTLDALQYLIRKIVSQKFSTKIMLSMDAGDFRATRKKELEALALEMAQQVKDTSKSRTIAPLNPAERRIIHVTLQTDTTIRSKSVGEGLFKKIKIYLPSKGRKKSPRRPKLNKARTVKTE